jgi:squalene-hopene/tetraprenyl-beta-curcumene cyclase
MRQDMRPAIICFVLLFSAAATLAATPDEKAQAAIEKGLDFLKTQQKPDGSWQTASEPSGISALVLRAFLGVKKYDAEDAFLNKGYEKLLSNQQPDGGIYNGMLANYNTAIAISALAAADEAEYKPQLDKAVAFIKKLQWSDEANDLKDRKVVDEKNVNFGGWGYGRRERADGSNVQMALDALHDAGMKSDDPAYQRALKFVSRLQNNSETNDQPWAGNDGGFIYTPADNGESNAGEYQSPDGKRMLRSYGSMTYAGLKSMIYAGLTKDDPRVKAAWAWVTKNWSLDENPGMKLGAADQSQNGMFYYYHTMARALNAYDEPTIADAQGGSHDWRVELIDKLLSLQKPDGSWVGEKRWMEDNAILTTSYVVLSLEQTLQDLKEHPATAGK